MKGRFLNVPGGGNAFRPTLERTRESVAEILKPCIEGSVVADLCAGSGIFGIELLSRGASSVDFVEKDRRRADCIRQHLKTFGIEEQCRVFVQDIRAFIRCVGKKYSLIFFDPPYADDNLANLISDIRHLLSDDGVLVYERRRGGESPDEAFDVRVFGDTEVVFYRASDKEEDR